MDQAARRERATQWLQGRPLLVDACLAATAVLFTVLLPASGAPWEQVLVGLALTVPLAWRRRAPVPAAAVVTAAGLLELVAVPSFLPANIAAPAMVYALAAYAPPQAGRAGLAVGLAGAVLASWRYALVGAGLEGLVLGAFAVAVTVVASWALGDLRRIRLQQIAALHERARLLELERDQEVRLAAGTERARIAREMHDVVAHSLSVVIAQADGGRYAAPTDPAAATAALTAIAETGRQALADMRTLLGVLRADDDRQEYAPQPDLAAIPRLVTDVRASGLDVELVETGSARQLPAGPALAAYRVVQESLTNVLKHAGPAARARVELQWSDDAVHVAVLDDGRGAGAPAAARPGGQGLLGMHERAQLHGGSLRVGPRPGGGFAVQLRLPAPSAGPDGEHLPLAVGTWS